jgi:hypothetical protein
MPVCVLPGTSLLKNCSPLCPASAETLRFGLRHMSDCVPGEERIETNEKVFTLARAIGEHRAAARSGALASTARSRATTRTWIRAWILVAAAVSWTHGMLAAQTQGQADGMTESITGTVVDPSGAVIPGATVIVMSGKEAAHEIQQTKTGPRGGYSINIAAGTYTVVVEANGFARFQSQPVQIGPGEITSGPRTLDIQLNIPAVVERVVVPDEPPDGSDFTGSSTYLARRDVEQMPLDPTTLLNELQGLAGGPTAELYVGGFSGAKLPPRDSISAIRIRQNAYSAAYDTDPGTGVIEVSTSPGTAQLHGQLYLYGDDSALNAGNPFIPGSQPGYYADGSGGSVSGSIHRKASYFAGVDQMELAMNSAVDAQALDANLQRTPVNYAVRAPKSSVNASSRLDVRPAENSTLMVRYALDREGQTNGGTGQLALASQGFSNATTTQTLQIANTQAIGSRMVNDTRFQYIRARARQTPVSTAPAIVVEGAFLGGGNPAGPFSDNQDHYEVQNYLSMSRGQHYLDFGGRLRVGRDSNASMANFAGQFVFSTLDAYQITEQGIAANESFAQIQAAGGGASQFSQNAGSPDAVVTIADAGLFAQDDWKVRQNFTFSYGLRFETQTYIADHADWAPRIGFSWGLKAGPKSPPQYVLHFGAGIFYRRFTSANALLVQRQNGIAQQEYVVESPQFCPGAASGQSSIACPGIPSVAELASQTGAATIYQMSPAFHAPYYIGESLGLDRRLGRLGSASVTYLDNRGVHTQLTENVNAPLPGTYNPAIPASGLRPNGSNENIYQFVSKGVYRSDRLTTNVTVRVGRVTAFGYYTLRFDKSDAESNGTFPSDLYNLGLDYGRSLADVRHTATLGEDAQLPYGIETSGYLSAMSGAPFNIVVGQDLNGDTQFNDRPSFATDLSRPSVVVTRWGTFDSSPIAGQKIIPRDYGQGPGLLLLNFALGKSFGVGPVLESAKSAVKGALPRKYTMELWAEVQNLLNHPNLTPPVGILTSPLFGRSLGVTGGSSLSPDRVVDLQLSARF